MVSKTIDAGSNPAIPVLFFKKPFYYGDCGEVVNAPDCGSGIRGFDPHQSPFYYWAIAKR